MVKLQKMHVAAPLAVEVLPALDVEFLNNATFHDLPLRSEIIALFRQQVKTLADQLALPVDRKSWAYLTHTLKGSASAVGALQLSVMADHWDLGSFPDSEASRIDLVADLRKALTAFDAVANTLTA
jgi:hypothetical protein